MGGGAWGRHDEYVSEYTRRKRREDLTRSDPRQRGMAAAPDYTWVDDRRLIEASRDEQDAVGQWIDAAEAFGQAPIVSATQAARFDRPGQVLRETPEELMTGHGAVPIKREGEVAARLSFVGGDVHSAAPQVGRLQAIGERLGIVRERTQQFRVSVWFGLAAARAYVLAK